MIEWVKELASIARLKRNKHRQVDQYLTIDEINYSRERGLEMQARHPAFAFIAKSIEEMFDESHAVNYMEFQCYSEKHGPMSVIIQRRIGETPAEQNARLRQRIAEIEAQVSNAKVFFPMNYENTCKNCKWRSAPVDLLEVGKDIRFCQNPMVCQPNYGRRGNRDIRLDGVLTMDEGGCTGELCVGPDFGCVHFSALANVELTGSAR